MAKQKQDNKTVDIELLILRDKIECLIDNYESNSHGMDIITQTWCQSITIDLKALLENQMNIKLKDNWVLTKNPNNIILGKVTNRKNKLGEVEEHIQNVGV